MYSYGPPHMTGQKQDDQLEHTSRCYVRIRDVALKTCQRRWIIGRRGERGSGISVTAARHKDDDIYIYIYIYIGSLVQWSGRPVFTPSSRHTKNFKHGTYTPLLNTLQYKVRIKSKVEQSRKRSSALLYTSV